MREALLLRSPFAVSHTADDDVHYVARQSTVFGPYHVRYRQHITAILKKVEKALLPLEEWLQQQMHQDVYDVAKEKRPGGMAFVVVLLYLAVCSCPSVLSPPLVSSLYPCFRPWIGPAAMCVNSNTPFNARWSFVKPMT